MGVVLPGAVLFATTGVGEPRRPDARRTCSGTFICRRFGRPLISRALFAGAAAVAAGCAGYLAPQALAPAAVDGRCGAEAGICMLGVPAPSEEPGGAFGWQCLGVNGGAAAACSIAPAPPAVEGPVVSRPVPREVESNPRPRRVARAASGGEQDPVRSPTALGPAAGEQIAALLAAKAQRTPVQRKIGSELLELATAVASLGPGEPLPPGALRAEILPAEPEAVADRLLAPRESDDRRVLVDIRAEVAPAVLARIRELGGDIVNSVPGYGTIRAQLPPAAVEPLAELDAIRSIRVADEAMTHAQAPAFALPAGADPIEFIPLSGTDYTDARLVVVKAAGEDRYLRPDTVRGELAVATAGNTVGHSAAADAIGVGAVAAATAAGPGGVFDGTESVETFSADGPRQIFFESDGAPITPGDLSSTGGRVLQKPDFAAADVGRGPARRAVVLSPWQAAADESVRYADADIELARDNADAGGLWSDGDTLWVADSADNKVYAYALATGARAADRDIDTQDANYAPTGLWSDGTTIWVLDYFGGAFAYDLATRQRDSGRGPVGGGRRRRHGAVVGRGAPSGSATTATTRCAPTGSETAGETPAGTSMRRPPPATRRSPPSGRTATPSGWRTSTTSSCTPTAPTPANGMRTAMSRSTWTTPDRWACGRTATRCGCPTSAGRRCSPTARRGAPGRACRRLA